jgi:hypothetical protein
LNKRFFRILGECIYFIQATICSISWPMFILYNPQVQQFDLT